MEWSTFRQTLYSKLCVRKLREQINQDAYSAYERKDLQCLSHEEIESDESNCSSTAGDVWKFEILIDKEEFEKLIINVEYNRREAGHNYLRSCLKLKPGIWEELLSDEIYKATSLECAFNFINHSLTNDGKSGIINGIILFL